MDGDFDQYLPTLWVETPKQVSVNVLMDGIDGNELETVARRWAQKLALKNDYFLAFRADNSHLKVVVRIGAMENEYLVSVN